MSHHPIRQTLWHFAMGIPSKRRDDYGEPFLISLDEAAHRLAISRTTLWRLVKAGELQAFHIGSRALIPTSSIEALLARGSTNHDAS